MLLLPLTLPGYLSKSRWSFSRANCHLDMPTQPPGIEFYEHPLLLMVQNRHRNRTQPDGPSALVICRLVLEGPLFGHYFDKVEVSNFEVASDAFSTFKVLLAVI